MIRRAVLVAAAAAALILAPSLALASVPAGASLSQADSTPAARLPFNIVASGAKANEAVTLTMTPDPASIGTRSLTKTANARGEVVFAVTLTQDGTYVLTSRSASGVVLSSQTVTVVQHGAVIVAGTSASAGTAASVTAPKAASATAPKAVSATAPKAAAATAAAPASAQLAFTGFGGMSLAAGGGILVLAGTGLVLATRRRKLT
jgi:hypothetical protein